MGNTRILPWAVLFGLIAFTAATYAGLPDEIPTKISSRGVITHTEPKTIINWFMLVGIAALTQGFISWLTILLPSRPDLFNFSEKERFLTLPREYQAPVIVRMQFATDIIATFTMLLMFFVQWLLWRTAMGHPQALGLAGIVIFTVLIGPVAFLLAGRVSAEVEVQVRRARESGHSASA